MESKRRGRVLLALVMVLGLLAGACSDKDSVSSDSGSGSGSEAGAKEGETIRMAPLNFAEARTLTFVYGKYLEEQGFDVDIQPPKGMREEVYPGLDEDRIDLIIDYSGSAAAELDPEGTPSSDPDETYTRLEQALEAEGLTAYAYSEAEDKNALVMLKDYAEENGVTKISDLKKIQDQVVLGGDADCATRTDCLLGYQDVYGIQFKEFKALDYGPALTAALDAGEIQAAQYQTTAPAIDTGDFVVLEDDMGILSADNIVPVLRSDVAEAYGDELEEALNTVSEKLTTDDLIAWNVATDVDKEEPEDVAEAWLEESGLL